MQPPLRSPSLGRWDLTLHAPDREYPSWLDVTLRDSRLASSPSWSAAGGSARELPSADLIRGGNHIRFISPKEEEGRQTDMIFEGALSVAITVSRACYERPGWHAVAHSWHGERAPTLKRFSSPLRSGWLVSRVVQRPRFLTGWLFSAILVVLVFVAGEGWCARESRARPGSRDGSEVRRLQAAHRVQGRKVQQRHLPPRPIRGAGRQRPAPRLRPSRTGRGVRIPRAAHAVAAGSRRVAGLGHHAHRPPGHLRSERATVIYHQEIPGITGGALDSHEALPGSIYLQGSEEGPVAFRNIVVTSALPAG